MSEIASTHSEQEANMEVENLLRGALPPGGASPTLQAKHDTLADSKVAPTVGPSEETSQMTLQTTSQKRKHDDSTSTQQQQHKKRKRKGSGKNGGGTAKLDKSTSTYLSCPY